MQGLEPWASCSQSRRATNCATPRYEVRRPGWAYSPKAGALPTALHPVIKLFYPAGRILPNLLRTLFLLIYSSFLCFLICFTYSLTLLSPLFPGTPAPSVVIYVVKNASRPVSGESSPVPSRKRFAFQVVRIVTLNGELCKWFLRG